MTTLPLKPGTIWITGLSASGKSTLGQHLYKDLQEKGITNIELLDGEELRKRLDKAYGYSIEDRNAVIENLIRIARESNAKGNLVIVCTISHKKEIREKARAQIPNFVEVYLDCTVDVCAKRDYKDHYRRAQNGEYEMFVGITDPYEVSKNPELVINTAVNSVESSAQILLEHTLALLRIGPTRDIFSDTLDTQQKESI